MEGFYTKKGQPLKSQSSANSKYIRIFIVRFLVQKLGYFVWYRAMYICLVHKDDINKVKNAGNIML